MPVSSGYHSDVLTDFATGYRNGQYFASMLVPDVPVDKRVGTIDQRLRSDVMTPHNDRIGPRSPASEINFEIGTTTYACIARGNSFSVTRRERDEADAVLQVQQSKLALVLNNLFLQREIRVADFLNTSTNFASANRINATAVYSDSTGADIILDWQSAIAALSPGVEVETMTYGVVALELWHEMQRHPQLLGLMGADERGLVSRRAFADWLELDDLFVSKAQKNTAVMGQTASYARIWDTDKCAIVRVPKQIVNPEASIFAGRMVVPQDGQSASSAVSSQELVNCSVVEWEDPSQGEADGLLWGKVTILESEPKVLQNDMGAIISGC